jgi:hypothetical protein
MIGTRLRIEAPEITGSACFRTVAAIHTLASAAVANGLTVVGSSHEVTTSMENASSAGITQ